MAWRYLFGDDVFISYSRRDGAAYAAALANELSAGSGLSCFLDQWGASAASELSRPVRRALAQCRVLVLVGTPGVTASAMVRQEVALFSKRHSWTLHRPLIPINVDGGLDPVTWTELEGLHRVPDPRETGGAGDPSPAVVRLIRNSYTFTTRNRRVRRLSYAAAGLLLVSLGTGTLAIERARAARVQEQAALENAQKTEEQTRLAETNLKRALDQTEIAKANADRANNEQRRAEQQTRLAVSRQLSASAALLVQDGKLLPDGVRTAIRAMQSEESTPLVEGYQALRNGLAVLPRIVSQMPHKRGIRFTSLSWDSTVLATADADAVSVWDARRGRLIGSRSYGRSVFLTGLSLSPDAALLAVGYGGTLDVLRVPPAGSALSVPDPLMTLVVRLAALRQPHPVFSPDGRYLAATSTSGGPTHVWRVGDWKDRATHDGSTAVSFSPDGAYLFLAARDGIRAVAPTQTGREVGSFQMPPATTVAFSADGTHFAAADDTSVRTWQWVPASRAWREVASITHQGRVTTVAISSDGGQVCVGSDAGTARVWDVAEQREVLRLTHSQSVTAAVFSRDASVIVTAGEDGIARMWETTPDASTRRLPHPIGVRALAFAPARDTVWTIADDGRVRRWDLSPNVRAHVLEAGPAMSDGEVPHTLFAATFDPTARHAGAAVSDGTVFLWNLATGSSTRLRVEGEVTAMAVGPGGDRVAVTGDQFEVWSTGQTPARRIPFDGFDARAVAFSPDGRYLGAAASGEIRVFDLTRERAVRTVHFRGDANGSAFSSNGTLLALADDTRRVSVWQWRNADARPVVVATERSAVGGLAFGSRDRTLAYTVGGRDVVVWDLPNRRELARLSHENEVSALGFSPDGRHLGTASTDRVARVLLRRPSDLIKEAQSRMAPLR